MSTSQQARSYAAHNYRTSGIDNQRLSHFPICDQTKILAIMYATSFACVTYVHMCNLPVQPSVEAFCHQCLVKVYSLHAVEDNVNAQGDCGRLPSVVLSFSRILKKYFQKRICAIITGSFYNCCTSSMK